MSEIALPDGWIETKINYFVDSMVGGASPTIEDYSVEGVLALNKGDIKALGKIELKKNVKRVPVEFAKKHENKTVTAGATIVTLRDLSQKADFLGLISEYRDQEKALITQGMYALSLVPKFSKKYLIHYSNSLAYREQVKDVKVGVTQVHLRNEQFLDLYIPLPPLAEQQQIAQKLDELLAQVDTLKTRLDAIPNILKRFRQSVLAAAVSGRLTEGWRAEHIEEILDVEKIVDAFFFEGITHGNFGKKNDKAALINAEEKGLAIKHIDGLPLVRIGSICQCIVPNRDKPKSFSGSTHWLLTQHFGEDSIWIDYKKIDLGLTDNEIVESNAKVISSGNVIMTCVGRVGLSAVLEERAVINQQLHAFIVNDYIKAEYLAYCIRANTKYFEEIATSTTVSYLNKTSCNSLPIPLPTLEEQTEIVRRVEQLFAYADQIEQRVKDAQARVNHLTQSILAKAFRGELTADWRAQNPELISGENSAAALLERIRAEREAAGKPKRKVKI